MTDISLINIKKNYGFNSVLDDFNLEINAGERIGLIGTNGCGKSTLFKIITGEENINEGKVAIRNGAKIGLLSQTPPKLDDSITVYDFLKENFKDIIEMEKNLKELEEKMATASNSEMKKILDKYGKIQQRFIDLDGYTISSKINEICNRFGLDNKMLNRRFNVLSGGEKTLVQLASIMLLGPDILLLDEPTNNLDINTLEWLENYLNNYSGTIIMSSHDRYFLDKIATKIVLIERGKEEIFFGNYSYYLEENERRILKEFEDYKDQQKKIEAMKKKIKQLQEFGRLAFPGGEPFFRRAASIQKRLDKLELLDKPLEQRELPISFQMDSRSGKQVLNVKNLNLSIEEKQLLSNASFNIMFKDRICIMGQNGSGKSTLINYIMNIYNNHIDDSCIKIGSNVLIGYIPQNIAFEDDKQTILETARRYYIGSETHLRASLAKFMFNSQDVFKKVGTLSGGEKVRLKLFELIQQNVNFLIMDEPTNHIDIATKEVLENALKEYPGTILFISHDRYFINKISEKILYISDKKVNEYLGNYDYYKEKIGRNHQ